MGDLNNLDNILTMDLNERDIKYFNSIKSKINNNIYEINVSQFTKDIIFSVCGTGQNSHFNQFTIIEKLIGIWYSYSTKKIYIIGNNIQNVNNCLKRIERQLCYIILDEIRKRYIYNICNNKIVLSQDVLNWYNNYINCNEPHIWYKEHEKLTNLNSNNIDNFKCILNKNKNTDIKNNINLLSSFDNLTI